MSDEDIDIVSVPKAIFEKKYISRDAYDALRAELARVTAERDALKLENVSQKISIRESTDMLIKAADELAVLSAKNGSTYCAFCGARFVLDDTAAKLVSDHILSCDKHPMREVKAELERVTAERDKAKEAEDRAENNTLELIDKVLSFAGQLQAWGVDGAGKNLIAEILGGHVHAPDFYALRAELARVTAERDALVYKLAAARIVHTTLNEILSENSCPSCGSNDNSHMPDCEMYDNMATLREIVEG